MKLLILGPPASGKGTQAKKLCKHFNLTHISTGDMLRQAVRDKTPLGLKAEAYMRDGQLVPDGLMIEMVAARLEQADCENGVVLDGFPRTMAQAQALTDKTIEIDGVLNLQVAEEVLVHRAIHRYVHLSSGRMYHTFFSPPKTEGLDDLTGEPLTHRADDNEVAVKARLAIYHEQSAPLIEYYQASTIETTVYHIAGDGVPDAISAQIIARISELNVVIDNADDESINCLPTCTYL